MQKSKFRQEMTCFFIFFLIISGIGHISCQSKEQSGTPKSGNRYKIIRPVYLQASYHDLDNRKISPETARIYLKTKMLAKTVYVAFNCEVPTGTVMTIIGPAPKVWHLPFLPDCYFVRLDPDYSRGLDIVLELTRGFEGNLDGLNPDFFVKLE